MELDQLSLFITLIALSAFFSGTEIALMTLSKHTIESFRREKKWGSVSLEKIRKDNDTLLITILIGNNLVNVGASALATAATLSMAEKMGIPGESGLAIVTGAVTLILLMFGEITPKAICIRYAGPIGLLVAPLYRILIWVFLPLSFLLNFFVKGVAKIFGADKIATKMSEEEVHAFIDMSHEGGAVEADERRQIKNLLSLPDTTADSVMTPRVNVEFLSQDMTVDEACDFFMKATHSRIPVYGENSDDVEFVLTFREAFKLQITGNGRKKLSQIDLEKIMKVPVTQPLDDLFEKFQKSRRHIALVVDEHGGTAGVVTMEDVLEEVFGDIKDEKDREEIYIKKKKDGTLEALGTVLLDDILDEWNIRVEELGIKEEYLGEPLSYIMLAELEKFPELGATVSFGNEEMNMILTVISIDETAIEKVAIELIKNPL